MTPRGVRKAQDFHPHRQYTAARTLRTFPPLTAPAIPRSGNDFLNVIPSPPQTENWATLIHWMINAWLSLCVVVRVKRKLKRKKKRYAPTHKYKELGAYVSSFSLIFFSLTLTRCSPSNSKFLRIIYILWHVGREHTRSVRPHAVGKEMLYVSFVPTALRCKFLVNFLFPGPTVSPWILFLLIYEMLVQVKKKIK